MKRPKLEPSTPILRPSGWIGIYEPLRHLYITYTMMMISLILMKDIMAKLEVFHFWAKFFESYLINIDASWAKIPSTDTTKGVKSFCDIRQSSRYIFNFSLSLGIRAHLLLGDSHIILHPYQSSWHQWCIVYVAAKSLWPINYPLALLRFLRQIFLSPLSSQYWFYLKYLHIIYLTLKLIWIKHNKNPSTRRYFGICRTNF